MADPGFPRRGDVEGANPKDGLLPVVLAKFFRNLHENGLKTWKSGRHFQSRKVREFLTDWKSQGKTIQNTGKKLREFQKNVLLFFE